MTRLEIAAIRLHKATQADRERSRKISSFVCEREGDPRDGSQDRPCWKARWVPDGYGGEWEHAGGDIDEWCQTCQDRQKIYSDKSGRQELGKAKRSFWAATKALIKACEV